MISVPIRNDLSVSLLVTSRRATRSQARSGPGAPDLPVPVGGVSVWCVVVVML